MDNEWSNNSNHNYDIAKGKMIELLTCKCKDCGLKINEDCGREKQIPIFKSYLKFMYNCKLYLKNQIEYKQIQNSMQIALENSMNENNFIGFTSFVCELNKYMELQEEKRKKKTFNTPNDIKTDTKKKCKYLNFKLS
jgi:hypothetical protein